MTLTHLDLDRIEGLAKAATPGPWMVATDLPAYAIMALKADGTGGHRVVQTPNQNNYRHFGPSNGWDGVSQITNADFIAALDPTTVLALITRIRELEEALGELVDTLASVEQVPIKDPAYGDMVRELGKRIGFGALMSAASGEWRAVLAERGDPLGSEFVSGPCRAVLEHDMARARTALQRKTS